MSDFRGKKSMEFVVAAFNVSTESFFILTKTFFLWRESKFMLFLRTFVKCFSAVLSKLPPTCPEEPFEGLLELFQLQVRTWAKKYRTFDYKALPLLSKQHSIGWEVHFWKILFFLKFSQFHIFWPREKLFWYFCKTISTGFWEVFSVCLQETFKSINFLEKHFTC